MRSIKHTKTVINSIYDKAWLASVLTWGDYEQNMWTKEFNEQW